MNRIFMSCLLVLALGGCRQQSDPATLFGDAASSGETQDRLRAQETFDRSIGVLFSLEHYPDLPGLVGDEMLTSLVDRLNKWLEHRTIDPFWQSDVAIDSLAVTAAQAATAANTTLRDLQSVQAESSAPTTDSITTLITHLAELQASLNKLDAAIDTRPLAVLRGSVAQLATKWQQLAAMNVATQGSGEATAIRAFARQLITETQSLETLAQTLDRFSTACDTKSLRLTPLDLQSLKEAVWMRQISQWTRGDSHREIDRAQAMFDWTVRNIDLRSETIRLDADHTITLPPQQPWQTVLLGIGTVADRAWVFIELLRQQRIDACLLTLPGGDTKSEQLWGIGVLIAGRLHLFLAEDGLPVPGGAGCVLEKETGLTVPDVATLDEMIAQPELRAKVALTDTDLATLTAHLVVTPVTTAAKRKLIEKELSGEQTMVLYTPPHEQRERFSQVASLTNVSVWNRPAAAILAASLPAQPFSEMARPFTVPSMKSGQLAGASMTGERFPLWTGRVLYLKGRHSGQESAAAALQDAITPDRLILDLRNHPNATPIPRFDQLLSSVNTMATYWLGHAAFASGHYESAQAYFQTRERFSRHSFGDVGRTYMLGRLHEQHGDFVRAAELYRSAGHNLRAQWLTESTP